MWWLARALLLLVWVTVIPADNGPTVDMGAGEEAWRALWAGALAALQREPRLDAPELVTSLVGHTARLTCLADSMTDRAVSWIRQRDWHIISSGLLVYTNDERFQVLHGDNTEEWTLQIKYVQPRDNGTYVCQIAGGRGPVSRAVQLAVRAPETFILGADEVHVHAGSALTLVCIVDKSPEPPQYVFWYHNDEVINYEAGGGVHVRTESAGGGGDGGDGARTRSTLQIAYANSRHAGNYSCRASGAAPATVHVYVTPSGDAAAATDPRGAAPPLPHGYTAPSLLLFVTLVRACAL